MEIIRPYRPPPRRARLALIMTALIVLAAGTGISKTSALQWFLLKASLRSQFPQVKWISTEELAQWLQDREKQKPLLLDVRTEAEWNVSHLPGARRVEPKSSPENILPNEIRKDAPIVTYCAVGYRSAEMAKRLRAAGFTNVQNLEGSIFQWANEHRPLEREGERVTRVHPYDSMWGKLLESDVRASL